MPLSANAASVLHARIDAAVYDTLTPTVLPGATPYRTAEKLRVAAMEAMNNLLNEITPPGNKRCADQPQCIAKGMDHRTDRHREELRDIISATKVKPAEIRERVAQRYAEYRKNGPNLLYPEYKHAPDLALLLSGVPDDDQEGICDAYLGPIQADLLKRGFCPAAAGDHVGYILEQAISEMDVLRA